MTTAIVIEYFFYVIGLYIVNAIFGLPSLVIASTLLVVVNVRFHTEYLRKIIKTFQIINEITFETIKKKLKVAPGDIKEAGEDYDDKLKKMLPEAQYNQVNKEIEEVFRMK